MAEFSFSDNAKDLVDIRDYIAYYKGKNLSYYNGFMDVDYNFHIIDLFDNFFTVNDEENIEVFLIDSFDKADFQYNPKGLSNYLYGTPDLWPIILRCNEADHPGELELTNGRVKVPKAPALDKFLSTVYAARSTYFQKRGHRW